MILGHGIFNVALQTGQLGVSDVLGKLLSLDSVLSKVKTISAKTAIKHSDNDGDAETQAHGIVRDNPQMSLRRRLCYGYEQ